MDFDCKFLCDRIIITWVLLLVTSNVTILAAEKLNSMSGFKILVANPSVPKVAIDLLSEACHVTISKGYDRASILQDIKQLNGVHALFWATKNRVDSEVLDAAGPELKVIGSMSAGYDQIDTKELKARGIKLSNTPRVLDNAVADVAMLLAMAASRRLKEGRSHIDKGTWIDYFDSQWMLGQDISNSTIGIIGLGGIGQAIARRLKGYDIGKLLYTGHREKSEGKELGALFVNLDTLNRESDFIFVSAPLTNETYRMCNGEFFSKMKKNAIFVNVARGQLVDQEALIKALKEGQIYAAGLDVMYPEPLNTDSELLQLPNVVLTPHIASATTDTRNAMAELTAKNILRGLRGAEMFTPVEL